MKCSKLQLNRTWILMLDTLEYCTLICFYRNNNSLKRLVSHRDIVTVVDIAYLFMWLWWGVCNLYRCSVVNINLWVRELICSGSIRRGCNSSYRCSVVNISQKRCELFASSSVVSHRCMLDKVFIFSSIRESVVTHSTYNCQTNQSSYFGKWEITT